MSLRRKVFNVDRPADSGRPEAMRIKDRMFQPMRLTWRDAGLDLGQGRLGRLGQSRVANDSRRRAGRGPVPQAPVIFKAQRGQRGILDQRETQSLPHHQSPHPRPRKSLDIPVDRAQGDIHVIAQLLRRDRRRQSAQGLHQLKQAMGSGHGHTIAQQLSETGNKSRARYQCRPAHDRPGVPHNGARRPLSQEASSSLRAARGRWQGMQRARRS